MAILKILSRHSPSYSSLISYILKEGKNEKPEILTHNLKSETVAGWTHEFLENEAWRKQSRSDQVYLFHEIISFHADENKSKLTPEVMRDLAKEYIRLRGTDGVMLGAVHRNKEHVHLHLAVSALKFRTGTSFRLSKPDLHKLKVSFQNYHTRTFGIDKSICEHGAEKAYMKDRQWYALHKGQRNLLKDQISGTVKTCFEKAGSQKEFLQSLMDQNIFYYERNGKVTGVEYEDVKFRFSGLGIDNERLESLPEDLSEEQKALSEIRSIREARDGKDRDEKDR